MQSRNTQERLAFEASIRSSAVAYSVHLFVGRGHWERHNALSLSEVVETGKAMKAAYPNCQADPIFYAIESSGHSTTINPFEAGDDIMIKTETKTPEGKRAAATIAKRAQRAAQKAKSVAQTPEAQAVTKAAPADAAPPATAKRKRKTPTDRMREIEAAKSVPKVQKVSKEKGALRAPVGKRADIQAAAARGELPKAPDFSAETHKRWRATLATVVKAAEAGDIKALRAVKVEPISSSRKAIDTYRNLCVTALEAQKKAA